MQNFIKIKGYAEWFLYLKADEPLTIKNFGSKLLEKVLQTDVNCLASVYDFHERLVIATNNKINYEKLAKEYGNVLIRQSGSFMYLLKENKIVYSTKAENFPS